MELAGFQDYAHNATKRGKKKVNFQKVHQPRFVSGSQESLSGHGFLYGQLDCRANRMGIEL